MDGAGQKLSFCTANDRNGLPGVCVSGEQISATVGHQSSCIEYLKEVLLCLTPASLKATERSETVRSFRGLAMTPGCRQAKFKSQLTNSLAMVSFAALCPMMLPNLCLYQSRVGSETGVNAARSRSHEHL